MLKQLDIKNYALIKHAHVDFSHGFTVITGETGAGKSILLEALGLVLGGRANVNAIRKGEEKCIIEAEFECSDPELRAVLEQASLDVLDEIILRRELTSAGRSRAFVNDSPVNVTTLSEVASFLVDLHGQQENLALQTQSYQLNQLDHFAQNRDVRNAFSEAYKSYKSAVKQFNQLKDAALQVRKDEDYFKFQLEELDALNLDPVVFEAEKNEVSELEHAEEIQRSLAGISQILDGDEGSVTAGLRRVQSELRHVEKFSSALKALLERISSTLFEIGDIYAECERIAGSVEWNPNRLELLRDGIDAIQKAMHKHVASTVEDLHAIREEYRLKLDGIASYDEELLILEKRVEDASKVLNQAASKLSASREAAIVGYLKRLTEQVRRLGMEKATIEVRLIKLAEPGSMGKETAEMWFDANGNKHLVPLKDSASGGEVARLMLALKSILAENDRTPSLIFDEIDTGVSGEIAKQIGALMRSISKYTQIISVTHLPGVAAKGQHHLRIAKREEKGQVVSNLTKLNDDDRVNEIAAMFSGKSLTSASLESARNLLAEP